eukprot:SAG11_NODE_1207_length_5524_cov_2.959447_9_plen_55_part_01
MSFVNSLFQTRVYCRLGMHVIGCTKSGLIGPRFRILPAIVAGTPVPPTSGAKSIF